MATTTTTAASQKLAVAVIGYTGGVGTCLLQAMEKIQLEPYALVRSSTMKIAGSESATDYGAMSDQLVAHATKQGQVPVIADVTASAGVQLHYKKWLEKGVSVVAANKGIFAGPETDYLALLQAAKDGKCRLLHETTVGAGLPTLGTLQALKASSHGIITVEGILSGTLAFVLGQLAGGKATLSQAVREAKELGYTEPDPRDDLNGMDVARKAVILARLAGMKRVELSQLSIESLVPESLRDCSVDEFMTNLNQHDAAMTERVAKVEAAGGRLHYAAKVDVAQNKVEVGLLSCEASHPFNNAGPDNMVAITTNFYTRPLVVQGAGAGGDVTATGVLADILQCAYQ
ncbi:aspartokinase/homoserine dehydrogenase 2, chloroplastic [Seminavis robusta]|uniref:Homoserine dehydrogenase n=1 Tax=Seminavis robusta TaxID=568900 RepID=A0A9N8EZD1_9STRA|nr:aspartokinase/homoserine dehydrogenase 2, chloroplastic [Seminavis robusta]|eukprot:Sro2657_g333860.1 aspartokinase/homoserine dehydrogenase 2, chloroplastic (345) ;mRNA; r:8903-9937